jgi:hypothetical protein
VEHEPPSGLDRATVVNGTIGCFAGIDVELLQEAAEADSRALVADADADGSVLVVDADSDHRPLETWIGHPRHRQEQLPREESGLVDHPATMVLRALPGKP